MIKKFALLLCVGIFSTLAHSVLAQVVTYNPARNVMASLEENEVSLSWEAPYAGGVFDYFNNGTTAPVNTTNVNGNTAIVQAIRFVAADLTEMNDFQITNLRFHPGNLMYGTRTFNILVWSDVNTGTPIHQEAVTMTNNAWNNIALSVPFDNTKDLYVGVQITNTTQFANNVMSPRYATGGTVNRSNYLRSGATNWSNPANVGWPISITVAPVTPVSGYQVTRGGEDVTTVGSDVLEASDVVVESGEYTYCVVAQYDDKEAAPACASAVNFVSEGDAVPSDVTAVRTGNTVAIDWAFTPVVARTWDPSFVIYENDVQIGTIENTSTYEYAVPLTDVGQSGDLFYRVSFKGVYCESEKSDASDAVVSKPLVATVSVDNKVYDADTDASITVEFAGLDGGDVMEADSDYEIVGGEFPSVDVAEGLTVSGSIALIGEAFDKYWITPGSASFSVSDVAITQAPLHIIDLEAEGKIYDGGTTASVTGVPVLDGVFTVDERDVFLSFDEAQLAYDFASSDVGVGIPIGVSNIILVGNKAGNYYLDALGLMADIEAKELTIAGIKADSKVYNGDVDVVVSGEAALYGVVDGDEGNVSLDAGGAMFAFADPDVNSSVAVEVSGFALEGPGMGNYSLSQPVLSADITQAALMVTGLSVEGRTYNGVITVGGAGIEEASLVGFFGSDEDEVTLSGAPVYTFADGSADVGVKAISVGGLVLEGNKSGNYELAYPTDLEADITPAPLAVTGLSVDGRIYNGAITVSGAGIEEASLTGFFGSDEDEVTLSGAPVYTFADGTPSVGLKAISVGGLVLEGNKAGNYELAYPAGLEADITPATLTIAGLSANSKQYDKTTMATVSGTPRLEVIYNEDEVTLAGTPVYAFSQPGLGNNLDVIVSGYTLAGAQGGNYVLDMPQLVLKANITVKQLTFSGLEAKDKEYDGTRAAELAGQAVLDKSGVAAGETVNLEGTPVGTFIAAYVSEKLDVGVHGFELTGNNKGNYSVVAPPLFAAIRPKALTVTGLTVDAKTYDGTTEATVKGSAQLVAADIVNHEDVTLIGGTEDAVFVDANVGKAVGVSVNSLRLDGAQKGNYVIDLPLAGDIDPAELVVSGVEAKGKSYDGTTTVVVLGEPVLEGTLYGDDEVVLLAGDVQYAFEAAGAGEVVNVNVSGLELGGAQAGNYALAELALSADISPAIITVTPNPDQEKRVREEEPVLTYASEGWQADDTEELLSGALDREEGEVIGTYPILQGTLAVESDNYVIDFVDGILFSIRPGVGIDPVKVTGLKVYPNPVKQGEILHVVSEAPDAIIRISSVIGALLQQIQATGTETDINITLPAGSYLLSVNGKIVKFIVR
jgi:hypothetical protein